MVLLVFFAAHSALTIRAACLRIVFVFCCFIFFFFFQNTKKIKILTFGEKREGRKQKSSTTHVCQTKKKYASARRIIIIIKYNIKKKREERSASRGMGGFAMTTPAATATATRTPATTTNGGGGLISRRTTSNGGANSLPGDSFKETFVERTLKTVDVFKRNDALDEFSKEGSNKGGVLTLAFAYVVFALVFSQVRQLFATSMRTDLLVDHDMDPTMVMNFDVSFPNLNCEHLAVDLVDAVGHRAFNLSGESIYKHSMSKEIPYLAIEHATMGVGSRQHFHAIAPKSLHPFWEGEDEGTPLGRIVPGDEFDYIVGDDDEYDDNNKNKNENIVEQRRDEYGYRRFALLLNSENFKRNVNAHSVLLVNFHAPWCSHCAALAPHYERGAQLVQKALAKSMNSRLSAAFAGVDCTAEENKKLCDDEKILAYPTIRVYRGSSSDAILLDKSKGDIRHFEVYHGPRTSEAMAEFTLSLLRTLRENDTRTTNDAPSTSSDKRGGEEEAPPTNVRAHRLGYDFDRDGRHESTVRSSGCTVEGRIRLAKVPGAVFFSARSYGQTIDLHRINSTHIINHFSFGDYVPTTSKKRSYVPKKFRKAWSLASKDGGGKFATEKGFAEGENIFASQHKNTIHEHHMQVVTRSIVPLNAATLTLNEYTFSSNKFKISPSSSQQESASYFDNEDNDFSEGATRAISKRGAYVKFAFAISPIAISHVETEKNVFEWLMDSVTILGGVVAFTFAFESILHSGVRKAARMYRKRMLGAPKCT